MFQNTLSMTMIVKAGRSPPLPVHLSSISCLGFGEHSPGCFKQSDSTQDLTFVNMTLNCPQTFKSYPSLMKITFLVDLLCLAIFSLEAIIKTKRRGLLVDGGYLRSR